jgi:hypothetical protein
MVVNLGNNSTALQIVANELDVRPETVENWVLDEQEPRHENKRQIVAFYHAIRDQAAMEE